MAGNFAGKVVLVTGSSSGIGRAVAVLLAQQGAQVVVTGRSLDGVMETRRQCVNAGAHPADIFTITGDLTDDDFVGDLIRKTIETFGKLNILVDATGKDGWEMSVDVMDRSIRTNFRSVLVITQKAFPHLEKTKGDIVNVSTFLAVPPVGIRSMPYYGVPKAALDHMTRSMAHEYALKGVRVNSVNPGLVPTSFFSRLGFGDEKTRKMEEYIASRRDFVPFGRIATSEDIAETVAFLADRKRSQCIIGQLIIVDGGSRLCCNIDMSDFKEQMQN
ncbi:unnamed protein product [Caenorhabditis bovis]|uniref:Uncharacterized protein n=1 Tax=Caenorhabditis bovis TaxID=2654633 RepID=A0A8S1F350_9PELO|nr:unnamed protein product [Caenorhabditis bovis]